MVDEYPPNEEMIRNTRHAYYAMVSYFDQKVGDLMGELERLGLDENTIIVVTSDHGEMLGEHGMWFKRTYFQPSVQVPLIVAGAGVAAGAVMKQEVSLVDLMPTFIELAGAKVPDALAGESLVRMLNGEAAEHGGVICEYYSEGVIQPMRLAVSGGLKYVYVHEHEEQLFDLNQDPDELENRIGDAAYAERLGGLKKLVHDGWDPVAIREEIIESQQRRLLIRQVDKPAWDVAPSFDPRRQYVRKKNAQVTNVEQRVPRVD